MDHPSTQHHSPQNPEPRFHPFLLLPPELQLKVWRFSLPPPRIIDVFAIPITETLQERLPNNTCNSDPQISTWVRTFTERVYSTPQPLPKLLHANHQSRTLVLAHYLKLPAAINFDGEIEVRSLEPIIHSNGPGTHTVETIYSREIIRENEKFTLLDPRRDILFLQDPPTPPNAPGGPRVSSLDTLIRWLDPALTSSLRRLAIPYYSWRKTRVTGSLTVLLELKALRELWVSFLGGYEPGERRMWSDEIGEVGVGGYEEDAWEEIRGDVRVLERVDSGWCVPKLGFVRHRGVLVGEFEG